MPYLGSTVFFVTMALTLAVALTAFWLAITALAPKFVTRSRERWSRSPVLTVLLGGVLGGIGTILGVFLLSAGHPATSFAGTVLLMLLFAFALAGTTGLAALIGRGLASPTDVGREWFQSLKGGAVLELTFLLPLLGWFIVAPVAVYGGFGAAIVAGAQCLFERGKQMVDARAA